MSGLGNGSIDVALVKMELNFRLNGRPNGLEVSILRSNSSKPGRRHTQVRARLYINTCPPRCLLNVLFHHAGDPIFPQLPLTDGIMDIYSLWEHMFFAYDPNVIKVIFLVRNHSLCLCLVPVHD